MAADTATKPLKKWRMSNLRPVFFDPASLRGAVDLPLLGVVTLIALVYLQLKKPVYDHELHSLVLVFIALIGWIIANLAQAFLPLQCWAAPALGSLLLAGILPAALPKSVVANKTPDQFIRHHVTELSGATHLLSNDLGAAAALAWRMKQPQVALYNTVGELKYGLSYPESAERRLTKNNVQYPVRDLLCDHKGNRQLIHFQDAAIE